jgi:hypothetical protein
LSRKSSYITILQFGGGVISALRARQENGAPRIDRMLTERFDTPPAWPEAIKDFVDAHGLADDQFYTVIPRHEITARIIDLPSQDPDEIAGMVTLNAEEFVPFAADELTTAFTVLDRAAVGTSKVLAAVVHQDVLHGHLDTLREAGIAPRQVFLSTTCLMEAVAASPPTEGDCFAVVNLAQGGLEVVVFNQGIVEYARGIATDTPWSAETEQARDEAVAELSHEIGNSLSAHRRESFMGAGATEVYLCSDTGNVDAIAAALGAETDYECKPAAFGLNAVHGETNEGDGAIPLVAVGAAVEAFGKGTLAIHLLPEIELGRRAAATLKKSAIRVAVLVTVAVIALTGFYAQSVWQRTSYLDELRQQANVLRPRVRGLVEKRKHLELLQAQVAQKGTALELLAGVTGLLPSTGVNITRYDFFHEDHIDVYGRSKLQSDVFELAKDLQEAGLDAYPQFARAQRMYVNDSRERHKDVYTFYISIPFALDEEEGANE